VSTDPAHKKDVSSAASFLKEIFRETGLACRIHKTSGHPVVEAWSPPRKGVPTVLIYGHYDVQPPEPLDEWLSPPFEPTVRKGNLYARGASDDKGPVMAHIKAVEAWIKSGALLPVNVRFLIEGEEEIGGTSLTECVGPNPERFHADAILVSDTPMLGPGKPAICYGIRGIVYMEVTVRTAASDLHSGAHGGLAPNAAIVIAELLGKLKRKDGKVNVPGFYRNVRPLTRRERESLRAADWDPKRYLREIGARAFPGGEKQYHPRERQWARPTLDINGLVSGFTGEGAKTIIPCVARAKISARLVPDQDPGQVESTLEDYLRSKCPPYAEISIRKFESASSLMVSPDTPSIEAAGRALRRVFGRPPAFIREGGSIPILSYLSATLHAPVVMMGFGRPDDNLHAPNEKFNLGDFHRGASASACYLEEMGRISKGRND
jgi:acetylornithine deacetylase/succinyl-diaminopimelate desuccinylase-like protein